MQIRSFEGIIVFTDIGGANYAYALVYIACVFFPFYELTPSL